MTAPRVSASIQARAPDRVRPHLAAPAAPAAGPALRAGVSIDPDLLRVPVGPAALHVERYGHGGPPVVLVHGFGTNAFLWRAVAPPIAWSGRTAFAIDLMGYGESDRPLDASFGIAAQAEYLDRALIALRLARAAVVGVDFGGAVALRLAATRPERLERLVVVNPIAFGDVPSRDVRTVQRNTARFALRVTRGVLGAAALLTPVLQQSVADDRRMPPRLVARYLAPFAGSDGVGHLLTLARSIRGEDLDDVDLGIISVPTLIVHGEEDRWVDDRLPERLAGTIAGSRLVRLPRVGRLVPEETPEQLTELLLDFLGSDEAAGREPAPAPAGDGVA